MRRLDASAPGFAAEFDALVNDRRESDSDVSADVAAIIAQVKAEGDTALADYTAKFDRFPLTQVDSNARKEWGIIAERQAFRANEHVARSALVATEVHTDVFRLEFFILAGDLVVKVFD